jgi:hypothetical protein
LDLNPNFIYVAPLAELSEQSGGGGGGGGGGCGSGDDGNGNGSGDGPALNPFGNKNTAVRKLSRKGSTSAHGGGGSAQSAAAYAGGRTEVQQLHGAVRELVKECYFPLHVMLVLSTVFHKRALRSKEGAETIAKRLDDTFVASFRHLAIGRGMRLNDFEFHNLMLTELELDNPHSSLYHMLVSAEPSQDANNPGIERVVSIRRFQDFEANHTLGKRPGEDLNDEFVFLTDSMAWSLLPPIVRSWLLFALNLFKLTCFSLCFACEALLVKLSFNVFSRYGAFRLIEPVAGGDEHGWTLLPRQARKRGCFAYLSVPFFKWYCQLTLHITFIALLVRVSASDRPKTRADGPEGEPGFEATPQLEELVPCMEHSFNEQVLCWKYTISLSIAVPLPLCFSHSLTHENTRKHTIHENTHTRENTHTHSLSTDKSLMNLQAMFAWGISLLLAQLELLYSRAAVDTTSTRTSALWSSFKRLRRLDVCDGFMFSFAFAVELGCYVDERYSASHISSLRGASDIALAMASFCTFLRLLQNAQSSEHTALMWQATVSILQETFTFLVFLVLVALCSFAFLFTFLFRQGKQGTDNFDSMHEAIAYLGLGLFDPIELLWLPLQQRFHDIDRYEGEEQEQQWANHIMNLGQGSPVTQVKRWVFLLAFFMYLVFSIIILLNLVIAAMNKQFQKITDSPEQVHFLMMKANKHCHDLPLIPPPLNLLMVPAYSLGLLGAVATCICDLYRKGHHYTMKTKRHEAATALQRERERVRSATAAAIKGRHGRSLSGMTGRTESW